MTDDSTQVLLGETARHLRRYRALLLESRSGAASGKEQEALAVGRLVEEIERRFDPPNQPDTASPMT